MRIIITKLRQIVREELINESSGDAMAQFRSAVKTIQAVLSKYDLAGSTNGTYNPLEVEYEHDPWSVYNDTRSQVLEDPNFQRAARSLIGLRVVMANDSAGVIDSVTIPDGEHEAESSVYIGMSDPGSLAKKGKPRFVNSITVEYDYVYLDDVVEVTR